MIPYVWTVEQRDTGWTASFSQGAIAVTGFSSEESAGAFIANFLLSLQRGSQDASMKLYEAMTKGVQ